MVLFRPNGAFGLMIYFFYYDVAPLGLFVVVCFSIMMLPLWGFWVDVSFLL